MYMFIITEKNELLNGTRIPPNCHFCPATLASSSTGYAAYSHSNVTQEIFLSIFLSHES